MVFARRTYLFARQAPYFLRSKALSPRLSISHLLRRFHFLRALQASFSAPLNLLCAATLSSRAQKVSLSLFRATNFLSVERQLLSFAPRLCFFRATTFLLSAQLTSLCSRDKILSFLTDFRLPYGRVPFLASQTSPFLSRQYSLLGREHLLPALAPDSLIRAAIFVSSAQQPSFRLRNKLSFARALTPLVRAANFVSSAQQLSFCLHEQSPLRSRKFLWFRTATLFLSQLDFSPVRSQLSFCCMINFSLLGAALSLPCLSISAFLYY